ncbi:histone-lysine N-methyltransferase SETMAR isoform X1 [Hydra vulgaris]|uniref:histone-lysine N-methyltransferase SETMAR isoform X1 n=1 Tax=Hydra vulgaris TaxID=6087 RepID=UPI001F5E5D50|nr:histone-lysine N-methyltransferase SETMAR isoform X1 [Hydra vulgaris]
MYKNNLNAVYQHIDECIITDSYAKESPVNNFWFGCSCEGNCLDQNDCFCFDQHLVAYNNDGTIKNLQSSEPLYECNDCCSCSSSCGNRIFQQGSKGVYEVFATKNRGMGLRTVEFIKKGAFVIEYIGELLCDAEARFRSANMKPTESNYILVLREHFGEKVLKTCIDAGRYGNYARFINHSCEPNLSIVPVRFNNSIPHAALFSLHNIEAGEELTFSYAGNVPESVDVKEIEIRKKCFCGSISCSEKLPFTLNAFS